MANRKFSPMALDNLLQDAIADTADLKTEIMSYTNEEEDDIVPIPNSNDLSVNNLIDHSTNRSAL